MAQEVSDCHRAIERFNGILKGRFRSFLNVLEYTQVRRAESYEHALCYTIWPFDIRERQQVDEAAIVWEDHDEDHFVDNRHDVTAVQYRASVIQNM